MQQVEQVGRAGLDFLDNFRPERPTNRVLMVVPSNAEKRVEIAATIHFSSGSASNAHSTYVYLIYNN